MISMIRYYQENIRKFIADQPVGMAMHTGMSTVPDLPHLQKVPDSCSIPSSKAFVSAAPGERRWTGIHPS
jgi:hypothetical protein